MGNRIECRDIESAYRIAIEYREVPFTVTKEALGATQSEFVGLEINDENTSKLCLRILAEIEKGNTATMPA